MIRLFASIDIVRQTLNLPKKKMFKTCTFCSKSALTCFHFIFVERSYT